MLDLYAIDRFKWFISQPASTGGNPDIQASLERATACLKQALDGKNVFEHVESIQPIDFLANETMIESIDTFRMSLDALGIIEEDGSFSGERFDDLVKGMIATIQDSMATERIDPTRFNAIKEFFTKMWDEVYARTEAIGSCQD